MTPTPPPGQTVSPASTRKPHRRRKLLAIGLLGGVAVLFIAFCSGLHFPMWSPRAKLEGRMSEELNLSLPAGARVVRGVREAYRDPAEFYEVEMAAVGDVMPFIAKVRSSGTAAKDGDPARQGAMGRVPDWWKTRALAGVRCLEVSHRDREGGYSFFYWPASRTVYVFWFRT